MDGTDFPETFKEIKKLGDQFRRHLHDIVDILKPMDTGYLIQAFVICRDGLTSQQNQEGGEPPNGQLFAGKKLSHQAGNHLGNVMDDEYRSP